MNEELIVQKYLRGSSIRKIRAETQCSYYNIRKILLKNGILRNRKEAACVKEVSEHPLRQKIIDEYISGSTINKIKEKHSVGFYRIKKILNQEGIRCRTRSEAGSLSRKRDVILSEEFLEIINGELLGDGCIVKGMSQSRFSFVSKHKKYADWLSKIFINNGVSLCGSGVTRYNTFHKYLKKYYTSYRFTSLSYTTFHDVESKWYNNRIKLIPKELSISPQLVLHWYLGDGSLINHRHIIMCTNCFNYEDQVVLSKKLNEELGIHSSVVKSNGYVIFIRQTEVPIFLEYIGPPPIKPMNYKWATCIKNQ